MRHVGKKAHLELPTFNVSDGDVLERCTFIMKEEGTLIFPTNKNLSFIDYTLVNCLLPEGSSVGGRGVQINAVIETEDVIEKKTGNKIGESVASSVTTKKVEYPRKSDLEVINILKPYKEERLKEHKMVRFIDGK